MKTSHEINARMEEIYNSMPEKDIPWNRPEPPKILIDLVESEIIHPCKAIDIGCGTGTYSIFLASKGLDIIGIDVSKSAIGIAKSKATQENSSARFFAVNMLSDISFLDCSFKFVSEWMILHHILPQDRKTYLKNISSLLIAGGKYLSVSFSEADKQFGIPPEGKTRTSPIGPAIYCVDIDEPADFFAPHFKILTKEVARIPGRQGEHTVNHLLLEKL